MSTPTPARRPKVQRFGLVGVGTAVLLVGIASPAAAAADVVIPLEPTAVALSAFPADGPGATDPLADPSAAPVHTPTAARYGGTLTVDLPAELDDSGVGAELDDSGVGAELVFDDNGDGIPEATYSSRYTLANPNHLLVVGQGTGSVTITLPADDPIAGDAATLTLEPLTSTLGPAFDFHFPPSVDVQFDAAAPAAQTVEIALGAFSQLPCDYLSSPCPLPTPVVPGSTVELDLTADSVLRELGLTDLTGVAVGIAPADDYGYPADTPVVLSAQVTGSTASVPLPASLAPGSHVLLVTQPTPSGGYSVVFVGLTLAAETTPAPAAPAIAAPATAASSTQAVVNTGLRSDTGVTAAAEESSAGTVAGGAGLLLLAGAGGVAVARTRRRPVTGSGLGEV